MANEVRWRLILDTKDFTAPANVAKKEFEGLLQTLGGSAGVFGQMAAAAGPAGVAVAAAMGAAALAVGAFAKATLDGAVQAVKFAGDVSDLSIKSGIAGESLQVLGVAGSLVGVTMEEASTAVMKMQQAMVKAPESFKQLGLEVEKLKTLAPEKQFEEVGRAILNIKDPAERTAATIAIFGKNGQEAMKLLSVDIDKVSDAARNLGLVMGDETRSALDGLGDSVTLLSQVWDGLWKNIGGAIASMPELQDAVDAVTNALGDLSKFVQDNQKEIQDLISGAIKPMADALVKLIQGVQFMVSALIQWKQWLDQIKASLQGGWIEQAAKVMGIDLSTKPQITGSVSVKPSPREQPGGTWTDMAKIKQQLKEQEEAAKAAAKAAQDYADQLHAIGEIDIVRGPDFEVVRGEIETVSAVVDDLEAALLRAEEGAETAADKVILFALALEDVAYGADQMASILGDIDGLLDAMGVSADSTGRRLVSAFAQGAQGVANFAAGMASMNPAQMVSGIVDIGKAIFGWLGASSRAREEALRLANQIRTMRNEFVSGQGGLDILKMRAEEAGVSLRAMFNARTVEEYEAAVRRVTDALDLHDEAIEKTKEAMERWHLSAEDMGPVFATRLLHEELVQIYQDYQLLIAGGADAARILGDPNDPDSMAHAINNIVQQSLRAGVALPASMRPFIQTLIDQKMLLDENGEVITDISKIPFTETLEAGVARLIAQIERLVNALLGIPNEVNTHINVEVRETNPGGGGQHYVPPHDEDPTISAAEGYYSPALPEDAFFQLHKGERVEVTPASETSGRWRGGPNEQPIQVIVQIGAERLDGVIQRRIDAGMIRVTA